ncbi:unnamed protein product [Prorocentrum cordatum]|uniref:Uncharacterized protein n=1 Tax=Prorocentrum cordatum TaxID=2364126 RepID=A0ABN9T806_9DINO|nr:unnamed protein product [Polarella glacialis]
MAWGDTPEAGRAPWRQRPAPVAREAAMVAAALAAAVAPAVAAAVRAVADAATAPRPNARQTARLAVRPSQAPPLLAIKDKEGEAQLEALTRTAACPAPRQLDGAAAGAGAAGMAGRAAAKSPAGEAQVAQCQGAFQEAPEGEEGDEAARVLGAAGGGLAYLGCSVRTEWYDLADSDGEEEGNNVDSYDFKEQCELKAEDGDVFKSEVHQVEETTRECYERQRQDHDFSGVLLANAEVFLKTEAVREQRYAQWRLGSDTSVGVVGQKCAESEGLPEIPLFPSLEEVLDDEPAKNETQKTQELRDLHSVGIVNFLAQVGEQEVSKTIQEQGGGCTWVELLNWVKKNFDNELPRDVRDLRVGT